MKEFMESYGNIRVIIEYQITIVIIVKMLNQLRFVVTIIMMMMMIVMMMLWLSMMIMIIRIGYQGLMIIFYIQK